MNVKWVVIPQRKRNNRNASEAGVEMNLGRAVITTTTTCWLADLPGAVKMKLSFYSWEKKGGTCFGSERIK